jgi:hypothetical protein
MITTTVTGTSQAQLNKIWDLIMVHDPIDMFGGNMYADVGPVVITTHHNHLTYDLVYSLRDLEGVKIEIIED